MKTKQKTTFGVLIGNRGFFPAQLCEKGRERMLAAIKKAGHDYVVLSAADSPFGSVESLEEARKCAALFEKNRHRIDGIIITLPNFGDERAAANAIRWSGLKVPVLVHAFPDDDTQMTVKHRRDSFCGKMSVCNNLRQYGIPFSLTTLHTDSTESDTFKKDLFDFAAVCRIVKKLRSLRVGALGARPAAFKTVRYSEKLLEAAGISVETLDLYELFGKIGKMSDTDAAVREKTKVLRDYALTDAVPKHGLLRMAKFSVAVDNWIAENQLDATAVQCWTAIEEYFGIVPCACMSLMSNNLLPSACEVDIAGVVGMAALAAASGAPSALVDWNNNYGGDPDKAVVFHCSNLPGDVFDCGKKGKPLMTYQEIISNTVGKDNAYGAICGRIKASPFTYLRVSTDDENGVIAAYAGEGEFTNDPLDTFGGYGVVRIPHLQELLREICELGFEHHVAVNLSQTGDAIDEALSKYMGWDVYWHD